MGCHPEKAALRLPGVGGGRGANYRRRPSRQTTAARDLPIARFCRWIQWRLSCSSVKLLLREREETNSEGDAAVTPLLAQLPASNEAGNAQKPVITGD